jgi:hypothetical protein
MPVERSYSAAVSKRSRAAVVAAPANIYIVASNSNRVMTYTAEGEQISPIIRTGGTPAV